MESLLVGAPESTLRAQIVALYGEDSYGNPQSPDPSVQLDIWTEPEGYDVVATQGWPPDQIQSEITIFGIRDTELEDAVALQMRIAKQIFDDLAETTPWELVLLFTDVDDPVAARAKINNSA